MVDVLKSEGEAVRITWMLWLREKVMLAGETDNGSEADCWARIQYE